LQNLQELKQKQDQEKKEEEAALFSNQPKLDSKIIQETVKRLYREAERRTIVLEEKVNLKLQEEAKQIKTNKNKGKLKETNTKLTFSSRPNSSLFNSEIFFKKSEGIC